MSRKSWKIQKQKTHTTTYHANIKYSKSHTYTKCKIMEMETRWCSSVIVVGSTRNYCVSSSRTLSTMGENFRGSAPLSCAIKMQPPNAILSQCVQKWGIIVSVLHTFLAFSCTARPLGRVLWRCSLDCTFFKMPMINALLIRYDFAWLIFNLSLNSKFVNFRCVLKRRLFKENLNASRVKVILFIWHCDCGFVSEVCFAIIYCIWDFDNAKIIFIY